MSSCATRGVVRVELPARERRARYALRLSRGSAVRAARSGALLRNQHQTRQLSAGAASVATMRRGGGQHNARRGPKPPPAAASASPTFESLADEAYQLSERAERRRGDQADELLAQCIALYQQALVLNPQHLDTRYNLCVPSYFLTVACRRLERC